MTARKDGYFLIYRINMNRKSIFFTSDWHLGHENAIRYDERPFKDCSHMHESLIKRFNSIVNEKAVTYFVGDMGNATEKVRKVINRLNGTKVLIWGNHDKGMNAMYNAGFDVVLFGATIYIAGERVTISHCPLKGVYREDTSNMIGSNNENWHGESRPKHQMATVEDNGQFHLHGHIHSRKNKKQSKKILGKQYDIGVTANNYMPVSYSQIESWINTYRKNNG